MKSTDLPPPIIKPTKTPSIVKDQEKESRFHSGATLDSSYDTSNQHAQPTKSGFADTISKLFNNPNINSETNASNKKLGTNFFYWPYQKNKKSNLKLTIVIIALYFGGTFVSALWSATSDIAVNSPSPSTTNSSSSEALEIFSTPPDEDLSDQQPISYSAQQTSCLSLDLPDTSTFRTDGFNDCEVSFNGGYSASWTSSSLEASIANNRQATDFISDRNVEILEELTINNVPVYKTTGAYGSDNPDYIFWVRDLGVTDDSGRLIDAVVFTFFQSINDDEQQQILESIKFPEVPVI